MHDQQKKAAIIAAVFQYIQGEEEAVLRPRTLAPGPSGAPQTVPASSAWAASGRQEQMQLRSLMQFRSFRGGPWR